MKLKTLVPLISLALATMLSGCNTDGSSDPASSSSGSGDSSSSGGTSETVAVSALAGGYWEIGNSSAASLSNDLSVYAAEDLPNVYVFNDGTQYYYDDDATPGTYVVKTHKITEDIEAGTLSFTYYDVSGATVIDGHHKVLNGILSIDTSSFGVLSGTDHSENDAVKNAVSQANANSGIALANKVAKILDTTTEDSGELRIKFADSDTDVGVDTIAAGKLTFDLTYQLDEDTAQNNSETGDSIYLSLYNADGTSNSNLHTQIILTKGMIEYRTADGKTTVEGTFEEGKKLEVELSWTATGATFSINGTSFPVESYGPQNAVAVVSIKLGDTSDTTQYEALIDNLELFSGSSSVFSDDFEKYTDGHDLSANPYNKSTFEATVIQLSGSTGSTGSDDTSGGDSTDTDSGTDTGTGEGVTDNFDSYTADTHIAETNSGWKSYNTSFDDNTLSSIAVVSNDQAKSGSNSLLIEDLDSKKPYAVREFSSAATTGSVSLDVYVPSTNEKSVYINIGTDKTDDARFFEVRLSSGSLYIEAGDKVEGVDPDIKLQSAVPEDAWNTITLSWDNGTVEVSVNGTLLHTIDQSETGLSAETPSQLTLYTGDNSSTGTKAYFDNVDSDLF
ncbi:LamG-like jellyroll fold domain-containing protein [Vibrio rumoiensis]|nr:LamG-like jellyroll fold domain-containing protein [Vibrio rumoiensis]